MIGAVNRLKLCCNKCGEVFEIDKDDFEIGEFINKMHEFGMGVEIEHHNMCDVNCPRCGNVIEVQIIISEYPEGAFNYNQCNISGASILSANYEDVDSEFLNQSKNDYVEYDESNPISIENYAKKLIGKTFNDVCREDDERKLNTVSDNTDYATSHENKRSKGSLGELIEERYFHYPANNEARADFYKAGVELKVSPYKINKNNTLSAKERLILTMIDYESVVNETFEESHFWNKSRLILLIYYLYQKEISNKLDYRIGYVNLFTPPPEDLEIIKHDYETIVNKIKAGKAHELSEGDTLYLGAATKAATSKERRKQPFSDELAKPRAFAFKNSYMTYVLNNYIIPNVTTYVPAREDSSSLNGIESVPAIRNEKTESILKGGLHNKTFEDFVIEKIEEYKGYSVSELCEIFELNKEKKPKNLEALLAYRMLGIKGNKAEEFVKANIVVKTIRIEKNNKIKESMSFPTFKFKELIQEEWEDSTFGNYLRETKFFFVVYKFDENNVLRLQGAQFWNIPYEDLEGNVKDVWEQTKDILKNGLVVIEKNGKKYNNFPKASENKVAHVRPHARNADDTYELPDGRQYPKQCFWLNNTYILSQLDKKFFNI